MPLHINEIHPNPEDGFEWIELFNETTETINVSKIKLYDVTGKSLKISETSILPNHYVIATASAILNNSGDTVLLELDGQVIESVTFSSIEQGKSYAKCAEGWVENLVATKGIANACTSAVPTEEFEPDEDTVENTTSPQTISSPAAPITLEPTKRASVKVKATYYYDKFGLAKNPAPSPTILITAKPNPVTSNHISTNIPIILAGLFTLIQIIFLVYLVYRRLQYK